MLSRRETGSKRCKTDPNTRKGGLFGAVGGNCLIFPYAPQRQARRCAKRAAVPNAPLCQVRRCAKCVTATDAPQHQACHSARRAMAPDSPQQRACHPVHHSTRRSTLLPTAVRTLPRQAGRGGNVIAAAEASAGTAFFLSTKITENTWKSGLRCDKIQIWI